MPEPTELREPTARDVHMANLFDSLDGDPTTRSELRGLVARKYPAAGDMMPETLIHKAVAPELKTLRDERAAWNKERLEAAQQKEREEWHAKLRAAGIAAADIPAVEKIAQERGNVDPEALALYYKETKRVATPGPQGWGVMLPGSKGSGAFFEKSPLSGTSIGQDWQRWRRERAEKDFADIKAGRPLDPVDA